MSFGDGNLHVQVAQLKTENARLKHRNGELEQLVREIMAANADDTVRRRMAALGIEVVEELKRKVDDLRAEVNEKDMRIYDLEVIIRNMYPAWVGWEQRDDIRREIEDAIQGIVKVIQ